MKKIAFVGYRKWAFEIYEAIAKDSLVSGEYTIPLLLTTTDFEFKLPTSTADLAVEIVEGKDSIRLAEILSAHKIDVVLFYGWSWIVGEPVLSDYLCLCLHPSPLPKYRGGTPIQHQIIKGEETSAVSIIKMSEGIDDGDVYVQIPFSLVGTLDDIFNRIIKCGTNATNCFIKDLTSNTVVFTPQSDLGNHPPLKRRKPEDSEILMEILASTMYRDFYNLVRALTDPYPNAFLRVEGFLVYITGVQRHNSVPNNANVLNEEGGISKGGDVFVRLKDGYAELIQYRTEAISDKTS